MSTATKPKNSNSLLSSFRKYHTWFGLGATLFIVTIAATGIYLNHKDLFKAWLPHGEMAKGPKPMKESEHDSHSKILLTKTGDASQLPMTVDQALQLCREQIGEHDVERIEIKAEHGQVVYKIKTHGGEVVVSAAAVSQAQSPHVEAKQHSKQAMLATVQSGEEYEKKMHEGGGRDWGKTLKDLHTGKIGGTTGKLFADFTALILVFLSGSGIYLWVAPILKKRRNAQQRPVVNSKAAMGENPVVARLRQAQKKAAEEAPEEAAVG